MGCCTNMSGFEFEDNTDEVVSSLDRAVKIALEAVGLVAEGDVKKKVPVDTGLLRNSITHAVIGQPPAIGNYASNQVHGDTGATQRAGTAGRPVAQKTGSYTGVADDGSREQKVFVGTNVEYAA